ncbi:unnamed protein product [Prunus brigantina]
MLLASRRPAKRASYSASLLEVLKLNRRAYSSLLPSGVVNTKPAPQPCWFAEPSTYRIHTGTEGSKCSVPTLSVTGDVGSVTSGSDGAGSVSSEMKSATA